MSTANTLKGDVGTNWLKGLFLLLILNNQTNINSDNQTKIQHDRTKLDINKKNVIQLNNRRKKLTKLRNKTNKLIKPNNKTKNLIKLRNKTKQ